MAYEAIRMANPGGMGRVQDHDISDTDVNITLLAAMELAKERDSIAGEYATGYEITLDIGLPALESTLAKGIHILEAVTQTYLIILSEKPDSLIARKNGMDKAREITRIATGVIKSGGIFSKKGLREIRGLDSLLRGNIKNSSSLNPGTTADLTAAVLFVYLMKNDLKIISVKTD
ncbi:MAG: hypothetical protein GX846_10665 [Deltaproteobacteria bacterium]|nr:hypothetical protein [Deltaproteobacteria bacterium]